MKRAFGYVRISKLDQETTSPQRQRQAIAKLCGERRWELVQTFEDLDLSAYRRGVRRPGFDSMMSRLDEVEAIVFWRIDRLSRSVADFSRLLDTCEAAGVKLVSTDQQIDTTSAMGRAFVQMTSVFAELESGTLSERSRQMHDHLRANGKHAGRTPFGWRTKDGVLVPHGSEQAVLVEAAQRYIAGESLRQVSADLGMYHVNLARMLRSERVLEALPPAVSGPLAQALAERGRTGTKAKRSLLGGIARCGTCGAGMTIVGRRANNWAAYSCRERGHVAIGQRWLEDHVSGEILAAIDTGKLLARLEKRRKRTRPTIASREIEARLELLETDFYDRGMMPRDRYLRRREALIAKLAVARQAEEGAGIDLPRELATNLAARWPEVSLHGRRRIISAVLDRVDVAKANGHGKIDPGRVELVWRAT